MSDLELTLSWLGMSQYLERFIQAGFDSWETLLEITEEDLEILNIDLGHRRKLQREISNTRKPAQGSPQLNGSKDEAHAAGQGKRSYRHHPKPDQNAPERPYSAYVLFSNNVREELKSQSLSFTEISRRVGEKWQALSPQEKERWKQQAAAPWEKYKADLTEYQRSGHYKQYSQYVVDFKRAQAAKRSDILQLKNGASQPSSPVRLFPPPMCAMAPSPKEKKPENSTMVINRVKGGSEASTASIGGPRGQRINQACESCRQRKTRCPGERPICQNCRNLNFACAYTDGKRDLEKKLMTNLGKKLTAYEALLLRFLPQLEDEDQTAIRACIHMPPLLDDVNDSGIIWPSPESDGAGEQDVSGVGSMGSTDKANEESFKMEGSVEKIQAFLGQTSEEKWLERVERELSESMLGESKHKLVFPPNNHPAPAWGMYMYQGTVRPEPLPWPEDLDGVHIDPYGLPIKPTADALVSTYFATTHETLPVIDKAYFYNQFEAYFASEENQTFKDHIFMVVLQIVFAIGAVHAHRTRAEWAGDDRDHLLYFARARMLSIEMGILNNMVYHGQVQIFGLGGMYFMATNQINRAWSTLGLSIRCAQALGMHLQNVTPTLTDAEKESRVRLWHSVVSLERVMTVMTGRPSMVRDRDCSVPLPLVDPQEEILLHQRPKEVFAMDFAYHSSHPDSSGSAFGDMHNDRPALSSSFFPYATAYFRHYVELNSFAVSIAGRLYTPEARHLKWSEIQMRIFELDEKLVQWASRLPPVFDVQNPYNQDWQPTKDRSQTALGMLFHTIRSIIHRPCLCRIEHSVPNQSHDSQKASYNSAKKCVQSARAVLAFLPDEPDLQLFYSGPLWWMLHHLIKRAGTVLLLEIAMRARHMPSCEQVSLDAKKAVSWLWAAAATSATAKQSWITLSRLLHLAERKIGGGLNSAPFANSYTHPSQQPQQQSQPQPQPQEKTASFRHQHASYSTVDYFPQTYETAVMAAEGVAWQQQPMNEYTNGDFQGEALSFGDLDMSMLNQFGFFQSGSGDESLIYFPTMAEMEGIAEHDLSFFNSHAGDGYPEY